MEYKNNDMLPFILLCIDRCICTGITKYAFPLNKIDSLLTQYKNEETSTVRENCYTLLTSYLQHPPTGKYPMNLFAEIMTMLTKYLKVTKSGYNLIPTLQWIAMHAPTYMKDYKDSKALVECCLGLLKRENLPYKDEIATIVTSAKLDTKTLSTLVLKQQSAVQTICIQVLKLSLQDLQKSPLSPTSLPRSEKPRFSFNMMEDSRPVGSRYVRMGMMMNMIMKMII